MQAADVEAGSRPDDRELGVRAYRALYEYSPDGVLFTVPDGRILAASPAACELLRLSEEEIRSRGRGGLADPTDDRWPALLAERDAAGRAQGVARMLRGDGSAVEVEMSSQLFTDDSGEARACTVLRDVSGRERLERELDASRRQLGEAERIARMGSWQWDVGSGHMRWSDGLRRLYGFGEGDSVDHSDEGRFERVHPDDREAVSAMLERALHERSSFSLEYRAIRADGRVRMFQADGDVIVDRSGHAISVVGVVQDVTQAARTRDALRRASQDFEQRAAELHQLATLGGEDRPAAPPLTARQLEVLRLIAEGLSTKQIATRLVVTPAAVKWHVREILARTGAANRAEAVARVLHRP